MAFTLLVRDIGAGTLLYQIQNIDDVQNLFPKTAQDIERLVAEYTKVYIKDLDDLMSIREDDRTYSNTMKRLDELRGLSNLSTIARLLLAIEYTHPQEPMRATAHKALIKIHELNVDRVGSNVDLYKVIKLYANNRAPHENLSAQERYFLGETLADFKKNGLDLPHEELEEVKNLSKELLKLKMSFQSNIAKDNRAIAVSEAGLEGLPLDFINNLKRDNDLFIIGIDYPTFFYVMENCANAQTRKELYRAFNDHAYPANAHVLAEVIEKRDRLAKILGFSCYAAYDLSGQMVKSIENAEKFIFNLLEKGQRKELLEIKEIISRLPDTVQLSDDGKLQPWDLMYVKNQYKKKYFDIDEVKISEYFPMDQTIKGLLTIYEKFFSLTLKQVSVAGLWHEDVKCIEAYDAKNKDLLGYLLLDLHPRQNKYTHACHVSLVPAFYLGSKKNPGVSLVIANLSKPMANKPSLFKREDMRTFFHEFGHALHALLSRTSHVTQAGTLVKRDFVELPSQMLEQWLLDKGILKQLSGHYITGESLPESLIDRILKMRTYSSGSLVVGQLFSALVSLELYKEGAHKNIDEIYMKLHALCKKNSAVDLENHKYASFDHLMGYGAKYYGYMWSKVFALDLFDTIKKQGLLNPNIGQKYIDDVLSKGGSEDPNILLQNFLGREPNQTAFLRDMGLTEFN